MLSLNQLRLSSHNMEKKSPKIQSGYVKSIHDIAKIGQKIMAQIIDIDEYNGKISLSIRSLEKNPQVHHIYRKKHFTDSRDKIGFKTLAHSLPSWIEENEAYLKAKKNAQSEDFL